MGIGKLIWRVYVMDMPDVAMLVLLGTIVFCWAGGKLERRRWWRWLCGCLLVAVVVSILYVTLGQRSGSGDYRVYLTPFHSYREVAAGGNRELYRSNFMNALLFYPGGLLTAHLLPKKWNGWFRLLMTVLVFAAFSAGIEYVQYRFAMGNCEIDDVIHNALGVFLGSGAGLFLLSVVRRTEEILIQKWNGE